MSLLNIGMSGLSASQQSLMTTGNNIANADTAGYSRQQTVQNTKASNQYGNVFIGSGTTLADVRRVYNSYLDAQLQTSTSLNSDSAAYLQQITSIDKLLSDADTGITGSLTKFFTSLQNVASKPTDDASRQLFLSDAKALSNRFNAISTQLNQQNATVNGNLTTMAAQVNKLASTVATLNQKIAEVSSNAGGLPNDLLDQRNESVRQLSELVGAQVVTRDNSYDIYLGNGQPLVMGNTSNTLEVVPGKTDPTRSAIQMNRGSSSIDITSLVTGGEMGGLLRYRNEVLDPAMNELGRVALVVADQVNSQLGQGIDKNGEFGAALFSNINSAAAITQRSLASASNNTASSNLDVTIADTGKLTTNDYQVTFTGPLPDRTTFSVRRLPDGEDMGTHSLNDNPPVVIDGFTLKLNNTTAGVQPGDSFKITPTRNAATQIDTVLTDSKRLAMASPLTATSGSGNKGTGSITQPVLSSKFDIYDTAANLDLQTGIKYSTPVKLVFGTATGGVQSYTVSDAQGNAIPGAGGNIVQGQANNLSIKVPMVDSTGAPIMDSGTPPAQKTYDFAMTITGTPIAGDSYSVGMSQAGSSDNRNGLSLVDLQTKQTVDTGAASNGISLTTAYGKLIENVGAKAKQGQMDNDATSAILKQATTARDSLSGVNLDDETGNLVKYQQYYTASSQIIKAAQEIFTTLINSL